MHGQAGPPVTGRHDKTDVGGDNGVYAHVDGVIDDLQEQFRLLCRIKGAVHGEKKLRAPGVSLADDAAEFLLPFDLGLRKAPPVGRCAEAEDLVPTWPEIAAVKLFRSERDEAESFCGRVDGGEYLHAVS